MKYLITGVNGFCGQHLVYLLKKRVYGISRTIDCEFFQKEPPLIFYECNLTDPVRTRCIIEEIEPDVIFHLAADSSVSSSFDNPAQLMHNNITSQINIFEAVRSLDLVTRIVIACSSEEYGLVKKSDIPVTEDCSFNPLSTYAVSKVSQDMLAYQYYKSYDMDIVRVRSFNLTGPGRPPSYALSSFAYQIAKIEKIAQHGIISVGNLDVSRDYTDVRDAVKGYAQIAEKAPSGSVYNLCSGGAYNLKSLLDILISYSTADITVEVDPDKFRPSDLPVMKGDNTKIKNDIGWSPSIPIHTTLLDLLDYWRKNA